MRMPMIKALACCAVGTALLLLIIGANVSNPSASPKITAPAGRLNASEEARQLYACRSDRSGYRWVQHCWWGDGRRTYYSYRA